MKKNLLGIIILIFFISNVFAVEITDLQTNITQGNQEIIKQNAELNAQISSLKAELMNTQTEIRAIRTETLKQSDLPGIYEEINSLNKTNHVNILVSVIIVSIASFCFGFISKSRGWL